MTQYISRKCSISTCHIQIIGRHHKKFCVECLRERNRVKNRENYHTAKVGKLTRLAKRSEVDKEKLHEYQRNYRAKNFDSNVKGQIPDQRISKTVISASEFLHVPPGKTEKLLEAILKGRIGITL